jgi:hypothetical protein
MTYRVRIDGLTPGTTYYFTVDAAQADGIGMGLKSPREPVHDASTPVARRRLYFETRLRRKQPVA